MLSGERIVLINGAHLLWIPGWFKYTSYVCPSNTQLLVALAFTQLKLAAGNALDFPFHYLKCTACINCSGDFILNDYKPTFYLPLERQELKLNQTLCNYSNEQLLNDHQIFLKIVFFSFWTNEHIPHSWVQDCEWHQAMVHQRTFISCRILCFILILSTLSCKIDLYL